MRLVTALKEILLTCGTHWSELPPRRLVAAPGGWWDPIAERQDCWTGHSGDRSAGCYHTNNSRLGTCQISFGRNYPSYDGLPGDEFADSGGISEIISWSTSSIEDLYLTANLGEEF